MTEYIHGGDIYRNPVEYDFSVNINPLSMPPKSLEAALGAAGMQPVFRNLKEENGFRLEEDFPAAVTNGKAGHDSGYHVQCREEPGHGGTVQARGSARAAAAICNALLYGM